MTTGATIHLVSACSSSEEFVAAFRRYVDRAGVFVPIAEPLAVGRRGRFALTLADGRVMVEGDGEVVAAFAKPSPLQGRVGMTVRFHAPDEASKTVLAEIEKARLVAKPPATSIAPRAANVPASPRAVPPASGGRIDSANALAECIAIDPDGAKAAPKAVEDTGSGGNVAAWKTTTGPTPKLPAIPDRPKTPSAPPVAAKPELKPGKPTVLGMSPLDRVKASRPTSRPRTSPGLATDKPTPAAPLPVVAQPSKSGSIPAPVAPASSEPTFTPTSLEAVPDPPERANGESKSTPTASPAAKPTLPMAPLKPAAAPTPPKTVVPTTKPAAVMPAAAPLSMKPAALATPTEPVAALPTREDPAMPAVARSETIRGVKPAGLVIPLPGSVEVEGEPTDLTDIPVVTDRKTSLGVGVPTPSEPTAVVAAVDPAALPDPPIAEKKRRDEPSGDWVMTPDAPAPTRFEPPAPRPALSRPSGDWLIQLDPERPDGWTEPERLPKQSEAPGAARRGIVIRAEPAPKAAPAVEPKRPRVAKPDEPKVQIDPTLIEPLPDLGDDEPAPPPGPSPSSSGELPRVLPIAAAFRTPVFSPSTHAQPFPPPEPHVPLTGGVHDPGFPTPVPGSLPPGYPTFTPGQAAMVSFPPPLYPSDSMRFAARRRGRVLVIAISAALVLAVGVVLVVVMTSGGGDTTASAIQPSPDEARPPDTTHSVVGSGAIAVHPAAPADAAVASRPPAPPAPAACFVDLATTPPGAEVAIDNDHVIGESPGKLELPCGAETKLYIRKRGYFGAIKPVTPTPEAVQVKVALARAIYSVKVSSSPAGATITVGGKAMGVTPTTVKLPAYETATLIMTKDGFATEAQTLTPKTNNQTVHVSMKKKKR